MVFGSLRLTSFVLAVAGCSFGLGFTNAIPLIPFSSESVRATDTVSCTQAFCTCAADCRSTCEVDRSDCPTRNIKITITVECRSTPGDPNSPFVLCNSSTCEASCSGSTIGCSSSCDSCTDSSGNRKSHCWFPCNGYTWSTVGHDCAGFCHYCKSPGETCP
jgi:hypothetical protein